MLTDHDFLPDQLQNLIDCSDKLDGLSFRLSQLLRQMPDIKLKNRVIAIVCQISDLAAEINFITEKMKNVPGSFGSSAP